MKCPLCEGELDGVVLRAASGGNVQAQRCSQCAGFWFSRPLNEQLDLELLSHYESPQPNYSVKSYDFQCPMDRTLLDQSDHDYAPHTGQYWSCPDCDGQFYPRGQLAMHTKWLQEQTKSAPHHTSAFTRPQATLSVLSLGVLAVAVFASLSNVELQAAQAQTLPNSGPSVVMLVLLALAYIAGTVLAVLGRKLPVIFMGWGVIVICLFGFSVIIFGP